MNTRKSGSFQGRSNALGHGGRAAQLSAKGVPGGVIGEIARSKGAAPGQKNFHGGTADSGKVRMAAAAPSLGSSKPRKQTVAPVKTDRGSFGIKG